jgi:hypothetical protein
VSGEAANTTGKKQRSDDDNNNNNVQEDGDPADQSGKIDCTLLAVFRIRMHSVCAAPEWNSQLLVRRF